jgi:hypothetical protein
VGAYHQMGHDSWNLVGEEALAAFKGLVLSPVNCEPGIVIERLAALEKRSQLDVVLDPQFYRPNCRHSKLAQWRYFDSDLSTADLGNDRWWNDRCRLIVEEAQRVGATSIASPAYVPRVCDPEYYKAVVGIADSLSRMLDSAGISALVTGIVHLPDLAVKGAPQRIASLLTSSRVDRVYLVLKDDLTPRAQRQDFEAVAGAMMLIRALEEAGSRVLAAFSGLDMLLWKHAGATDAATGKFFNLRRFDPDRWEEDSSTGGRQLPYWTDDELITWLREDDVRLLLLHKFIDRDRAAGNPYAREILDLLGRRQGEPWIALSWKQYLYWFAQREAAARPGGDWLGKGLQKANATWQAIAEAEVYLFDPQFNNGNWVRAWLNALSLK